jgi:hypothetical protein
MKKVLIIANLFHASPRIPGLAKYIPEFNWEPVVLTVSFPENFNFKKVETSYSGDIFSFWRKILKFSGFKEKESFLNQVKEKFGITSKKSFIDILFNFYRTIFAYPDEEKGWRKPAIMLASQLLKKEKFDAIISSSSPVTAHLIAYELKKNFHLPWIADLRDLWTQNHNYPYFFFRKFFERKLELKTLGLADALITVSISFMEELRKLHQKENICTITNGFDPEKVNDPPSKLIPKFVITYTGQIYPEKQDPLKILFAIKNLISKKLINPSEIEVRFFGPRQYFLEKEIEKHNLFDIFKQYGQVPREISLRKQWESQILLLLNWEDMKEKGVIPGKIFEYLAARRPILATGGYGDDEVEKILKETNAGIYCKRVEDIEIALRNFYLEYKENGFVSFLGDWQKIQNYSQREMAKRFAEILNKISTQNEKRN